jgi:hypothetical protein
VPDGFAIQGVGRKPSRSCRRLLDDRREVPENVRVLLAVALFERLNGRNAHRVFGRSKHDRALA